MQYRPEVNVVTPAQCCAVIGQWAFVVYSVSVTVNYFVGFHESFIVRGSRLLAIRDDCLHHAQRSIPFVHLDLIWLKRKKKWKYRHSLNNVAQYCTNGSCVRTKRALTRQKNGNAEAGFAARASSSCDSLRVLRIRGAIAKCVAAASKVGAGQGNRIRIWRLRDG